MVILWGQRLPPISFMQGRFQKQKLLIYCLCNNTSPAFLIHYIVLGYFQNPRLIFPSVLILYGTPILLTFFFRIKKYFASSNTTDITSPFTISKIPSCSLDFCLMDSSEAIVKIGGYIILFSVILNLLQKLPISHPFYQLFLLPSLELTNGCALLNKTITAQTIPLSFPIYYSLCMGHTAFGGLDVHFFRQAA